MNAPVAKTKAEEAYELLLNLEGFRGSNSFEFQRKRFQKAYKGISGFDMEWLYFYETIDASMSGDLKSIKNYVNNININELSSDLAMNSLSLCCHTGLFYQAGKLIKELKLEELDCEAVYEIAKTNAILGFTEESTKAIEYLCKYYPNEAEPLIVFPMLVLKSFEKKGINPKDLNRYWEQFENVVTTHAAKPKMFSRNTYMSHLTADGDDILSVEFIDYKDLSEDEMFQISDDIADGLSSIDAPIEVLSFITADITYMPLEGVSNE